MPNLRRLSDAHLQAEARRVEVLVDRLDDATWPAAGLQRAECIERLEQVRAEIKRRALRLRSRTPRQQVFDSADNTLHTVRHGISLAILAALKGDAVDATAKARQCLVLIDSARDELARLCDAEEAE